MKDLSEKPDPPAGGKRPTNYISLKTGTILAE